MDLKLGTYILNNGLIADIIRCNKYADVYQYEGYIMIKNEPFLETAWNKDGTNIDRSKYNIRQKCADIIKIIDVLN